MSWLDQFFGATKAQFGLYTDGTATGAVALTAVQAQSSIFVFGQALTGNVSYFVPSGTIGVYTVDASHAALGAFSLSVGVLGGTPISLTAAMHLVYSDGTNMHQVF